MSAVFTIKQGDTLPALRAQLLGPDDQPIDLSLATVEFRMGDHVNAPAVIEDPKQGRVRFDWRSEDTNVPGTHYAEFVVTFLGGATQRVPNDGYVLVQITRSVGGVNIGA